MEEIKEGYTRVSQIIGQWNQYAHIPKHVLKNKCRIGSEVHQKIEGEIEGFFVDISEDAQGYFDSWEKWTQEIEKNSYFDYLISEKRYYCDELKITGCIDALVDFAGWTGILDYKTSAQVHPKSWALQASFYYYFLHKYEEYDIEPAVKFIHLQKDGSCAKEIEIKCTNELWEVAQSSLHTYRYFNA